MERTHYSDEIKGERRNYNWTATFDWTTGGFLGITQKDGGDVKDRVLLSPKQVEELLAFVKTRKRSGS